MYDDIIMNGRDAVSGKLAECFVTIDNRRYKFMQIINFEATYEKTKTTVPILGSLTDGNKASGGNGKFTGTAHYNQSVFRMMLLKYQETGEDTYFETQVTNYDPTSAAGRQTIIYEGCNLDGGILSKFDATSDYLDEDISGTFERFRIPEQFDLLPGMV